MSPFTVRRPSTIAQLALGVAAITILATACRSAPTAPPPSHTAEVAVPRFSFDRDTFAFPNDIRAFAPEREDLYANYCFVLARGMRQFFLFARFDPTAARLDHRGYVDVTRQVVARMPWRAPIPSADRVVIPGYADLRTFSSAEASAVKEGLGGRLWTFVHWTNWRVALPLTRDHQAAVLDEIQGDLAAGRLVQLLITNWPIPELNHTVVAFASRTNGAGIELSIWDPNEPARPGIITFDTAARRFWSTRVYATRPQVIRVFRMYYSPVL